MPQDVLGRLKSGRVLMADGATGTMLQAAGLPAGTQLEEWNITQPDQIMALHRAYLEAGSKIILANTFGGNRLKLNRARQGEIVERTNRLAVEIALKAAEPFGAIVAADFGSTGDLLEPLGTLTYERAVEVYAEQARLVAEAGADAIWIETMSDLSEARAAIDGAKSATSLPVLCSFSFDSNGRTMMGLSPEKAARALLPLGLAAFGANCGAGLEDTLEAVRAMAAVAPDVPLIAKPNAGLPHLEDGKSVFDTTPEDMAEYALRFREAGAVVIGGCCGSTPAHIRAMADALKQ